MGRHVDICHCTPALQQGTLNKRASVCLSVTLISQNWLIILIFRRGIHLYMSLFLSVCLCLSVAHHISVTVHMYYTCVKWKWWYLQAFFFLHFFKFWFWGQLGEGEGGVKREKIAQNEKSYTISFGTLV